MNICTSKQSKKMFSTTNLEIALGSTTFLWTMSMFKPSRLFEKFMTFKIHELKKNIWVSKLSYIKILSTVKL